MPVTYKESEHQCVLRLEGAVDAACAAELKARLLQGLSHEKDVLLDLSDATYLDVTALQLLWAAIQKAKQEGKSLVPVNDLPENLSAAIQECGLDPLLTALIPPHIKEETGTASGVADD